MKNKLELFLAEAIAQLIEVGVVPAGTHPVIKLERPRQKEHGDWSTNLAMLLSKVCKHSPRVIAEQIVVNLSQRPELEKVEIAGPGFINMWLRQDLQTEVVRQVLQSAETYGSNLVENPQSFLVEYVSANPTGPLHVGHGRGAAYGSCLSNLLKKAGHQVHQEYYVNDAGRQMDILAVSTYLRYLELHQQPIAFPENLYQGDYLIALAESLQQAHGEKHLRGIDNLYEDLGDAADQPEAWLDGLIRNCREALQADYQVFFDAALNAILDDIKQDLQIFGVQIDRWFNESTLVKKDIPDMVKRLKKNGNLQQRDGAWWFNSTHWGDEKDRVVIRSNGDGTYFASDIAYHLNKINRGFDTLINVWGADHHGYIARVKAAMSAIDLNPEQLEVLLVQFANLIRDGVKVSMSTRSGEFIALKDLYQEVGVDATRFFYVSRSCDQHMNFDMSLAKSQTNENPVYYIQYAHARICSALGKAHESGIAVNVDQADLSLLNQDIETSLMNAIAKYPETILIAAQRYEPHQLTNYLKDLAKALHNYYNQHKFILEDEQLTNARLCLISAVRIVISDALAILGVSAPKRM